MKYSHLPAFDFALELNLRPMKKAITIPAIGNNINTTIGTSTTTSTTLIPPALPPSDIVLALILDIPIEVDGDI